MRIISGSLGGRRLNPPLKKWPTRPTTDRAREALFNILSNIIDLPSLRILELFGGTGAHAFECISRGCQSVTYVDRFHGCIKYVHEQAQVFGISDQLDIIKKDVRNFITEDESTYDYVFADPPYDLKWLSELPNLIIDQVNLSDNFLVVIEHDHRNSFDKHPAFYELRKYGDSYFSFFSKV